MGDVAKGTVQSQPATPEVVIKTTTPAIVQRAESSASSSLLSGVLVIGLAFGLLITPLVAKRYKGMGTSEISDDFVAQFKMLLNESLALLNRGIQKVTSYFNKLKSN